MKPWHAWLLLASLVAVFVAEEIYFAHASPSNGETKGTK